ncbi:uncharacterized protein [Asterias amurensis]|uniref:uncharacterized protein isoform X2 n=1 Tax=Asterias amurensis TaxID=7602 RepID=UPI003AB857CC
MSADEDTELRDLVAQTLESSGVLGKIRAELRASVFLALEEQDAVQNKTPFINQDLKKFLSTKEGFLIASVVQEFLEHFRLDFTLAVFNPETNFGEKYEGRETLSKDLDIVDSDKSRGKPLLCELLKRANEQSSRTPLPRANSRTESDGGRGVIYKVDLTAVQIADAKEKFEYYDKDKSGSIDKDELRSLFIDMFPHFHRNMLERYVNDEFRAGDSDFSSCIDFDEFLGMYRRLFVVCRSVVSHDVSEILPQSQRRLNDSIKTNINLKPISVGQSNNFNKKDGPGAQNLPSFTEKSELRKPIAHRQRSLSAGSEGSEDSFFDEVPSPGRKPPSYSLKPKRESPPPSPPKTPPLKAGGLSSLLNAPSLTGSGMGSLAGAPSLSGKGGAKDAQSPDWKDLKALDNKLDKMSFDLSKSEGSEDYEDDFQSSQDSQSVTHSRGQKSQKSNEGNSISEDISEDIQEEIDISGDDDFLASSQEKFDELTTDRSVSQLSGHFDYTEDAQLEF